MSSWIRRFLLLMAALLLLLTTGCWSSKQIEDLSVYVALALDVAEETEFEQQTNAQGGSYPKNNVLTATVQIVPQDTGAKEKQGETSSSSGSSYLNEQLTGDSLHQIFRQFSLRRDRPLIGHHLKVIVVSSELSHKYRLEQLLDFVLRDNDIRPSCLVLVSHKKASDAINSTEPGEIPGFYLTGLIDSGFRSNKILPPMSLAKLDGKMQSGSSFLLQNVLSAKGEHKISGAGVYKGKTKKWIGELSQTDLEGISWIMGTGKGGALKSYAPRDGHTVTYELKSTKSEIIPKVQGKEISFHVKVKSEGRLIEDWSAPEIASTEKYIKELEGQFQDTASEQVRQVLHKMQETYHVDVAGFGERLRIKYPRVWKQVKENWDETFSHVPVTYDLNMKITDPGSSTD